MQNLIEHIEMPPSLEICSSYIRRLGKSAFYVGGWSSRRRDC